jgi:hypothetical protein
MIRVARTPRALLGPADSRTPLPRADGAHVAALGSSPRTVTICATARRALVLVRPLGRHSKQESRNLPAGRLPVSDPTSGDCEPRRDSPERRASSIPRRARIPIRSRRGYQGKSVDHRNGAMEPVPTGVEAAPCRKAKGEKGPGEVEASHNGLKPASGWKARMEERDVNPEPAL